VSNTYAFHTAFKGSACRRSLSSENGLETAHQQENDHDYKDNAKDTTRAVTPASAVRPSRNNSNKDQDEKDKKNGPDAHDVALPPCLLK